MIDLTKYDKAEVLAALFNYSKAQGILPLNPNPVSMTREEARELLKDTQYFDYLKGRVMKVDLSGDKLDPCLYDYDNGDGAVGRVLLSVPQINSG